MVVCQIVHLRNLSLRNFRIVTDDPFYSSPSIAGEVVEDSFEIPPHFDAAAEGLVVPWSSTTFHGLIIMEVESGQIIRCTVGPKEDASGSDWLRLHDVDWCPIDEERWLALGARHWFGALGTSVQLQLTLIDPFNLSSPGLSTEALASPGSLAACVSFGAEVDCAPASTVFLNVYDLAPATSGLNSLLCNTMVKTFGAFHAAIEVYGTEWGFYRQPEPEVCGVCRSRRPRHHPVHVYRQSVNLGQTELTEAETIRIMKTEIAKAWPGGRYDLIHCNCIHFCDELSKRLGARAVPSWVRSLHETGAAAASVFRTFSQLNFLNLTTDQEALANSPAEETLRCVEVKLLPESPGLPELCEAQQLPRDMTIRSLREILPVLLGLGDAQQYELQLLAAGCKVEDSQSLGKLVDEYGQQSLRLNLRRVPVAAVEEASSASTKHAAASLIAE